MDVFSEIIKPVVQVLMVPVKKHIGYLISCTAYVRDMGTKMRELNAARDGVEDHINRNTSRRFEVPDQAGGWLEDVRKIIEKVENTRTDVGGCFNLKIRHTVGRKAFKMIEEIDSAMRRHSLITWTDHPIPLGRVESIKASASTPSSDHHKDFDSREQIFVKALEALGPNHESHMIALWGMGGVGKTTMMQKLKKVVTAKKMFSNFVEAVIGEKTDPIAIQEAVADYLGIELQEKTKPARAEKLRKWFEAHSDGGKTKYLIILDDVWQFVDLNDLGLSPFPNQGVDFKVLLTTRDRDVCTMMGVEATSILNVKVLTEAEAQSFFLQCVKSSDDADLEPSFHEIGDSIASRCHGLPIAIRTISYTLKGRSKHVWEDALARLEHYDIHKVVNEVFEISYNSLQDEETESIFLLCGLFPEDFNIPAEDLLRYGWGLKLFKRVSTIRQARNRLKTCIERLKHTNLLIESDVLGCVKMHDLALAFVLDIVSKGENASFVHHGNILERRADDISDSYKRISLSCMGMDEFPTDLKFANLSLLKLMNGYTSLRFPKDFYARMEKLQVISYDRMRYPLLPSSFQCSTNLRALCLYGCSLMFDCSSVGNLLNLEILSMAGSGTNWLPSTIGKLKKLRILDLTDCFGLRIDSGVVRSLVKLEELYLGASERTRKAICFTDDNCNELAERSKNLSALQFEFFENNAQPKNMSLENLDRFKISVGCSLDADWSKRRHSYTNTLKLVTSKGELFESRMNELFEKTEVLSLRVDGMNDLSDVEVKSSHSPQSSSFYNLRVLVVSKCAELTYLFTLGAAKALSKLEHLQVDECNNMEELIHTEGSGEETITFPKLMFMSLIGLPKLSGLCLNANIIELPELVELKLGGIPNITSIYTKNKLATSCLLKEEVVIPKLEKLQVEHMDNLKEIWPREFRMGDEDTVSLLRELRVNFCFNLENLLPCNPMPFLHHLERLSIAYCHSIYALFNIDLDYVCESEEGTSSLKIILMTDLGNLREVWRIKGENNSHLYIHGFQGVERISIYNCERFRYLLEPTTANFDLGALMDLCISESGESGRIGELVESSQGQEIHGLIKKKTSKVGDSISKVVFPSYDRIPSFHNLRKLRLSRYEGVEVVFEIENPCSIELATTHDNQQSLLFPYLEDLVLIDMVTMRHVWKFNWNELLVFRKQPSLSPFHNLTTIHMKKCKSVKCLFSSLMAKLLSNLKKVEITLCDGIEEVVSNRDEDQEKTTSTSTHTSTTSFPHLDVVTLRWLKSLKCIDGGGRGGDDKLGNDEVSFNNTTTSPDFLDQFKFSQGGAFSWSLCQYSREIDIDQCHALSCVIPSYSAGKASQLEVLRIKYCESMKEVFETQGTNVDVGNGAKQAILSLNNVIMPKLPNLKILQIVYCDLLEHVFPFSALESLRQLEELTIDDCMAMKVIVKQEHDGEQTTMASSNVVVFPRLKSIALLKLPKLMGFFLGMNKFSCPLLDKVEICDCPQILAFAPGGSTTPNLKYIKTSLGKHSLEGGLNFRVPTILHQPLFPSLDNTTLEGTPWSLHNLIEMKVEENNHIKKIITSNELLKLQNLEKIYVWSSYLVEEVFEGTNGGVDESQTIVKFPKLREVDLRSLSSLRNIWKSNKWTVFEFPNLTRLSIIGCYKLEHVFTSSMVGSLLQLQELHVSFCNDMVVIVNNANVALQVEAEEESDGKMNEITLPSLKSLTLERLPCLKGFCLRKEDFSFPLLDTLTIKNCTSITVFTMGITATPELKEIETSFGSFHAAGEDINSFIKIKQEVFKRN